MGVRGSGYIARPPGGVRQNTQTQVQQPQVPPIQQEVPQQPQMNQFIQDVQTGYLGGSDDSFLMEQEYDDYAMSNPMQGAQINLILAGPIQSNPRYDIQMFFADIDGVLYGITSGMASPQDISFVVLERWYQNIPRFNMNGSTNYFDNLYNIIESLYNNMMEIGTDKIKMEWLQN